MYFVLYFCSFFFRFFFSFYFECFFCATVTAARFSLYTYMYMCRQNTRVAGKSWRYALWHWNRACWNFPVVRFVYSFHLFLAKKTLTKKKSWSDWVYMCMSVCVSVCFFFFSRKDFASYSFIDARRAAYTSQKSFNIDRRTHSVWLAQALTFFLLFIWFQSSFFSLSLFSNAKA